ncbi:hypothetical protein ACIRRA_17300 [Nocardia sp. NPDC101769]|uniref:hypothetical protein n=1 Tax=Nocardia sp. NPDC101769 TaxID=3364333 RepID=UPI0038266E57
MRKIRVLGVAAAATGPLFAGAGPASADGTTPANPTTPTTPTTPGTTTTTTTGN